MADERKLRCKLAFDHLYEAGQLDVLASESLRTIQEALVAESFVVLESFEAVWSSRAAIYHKGFLLRDPATDMAFTLQMSVALWPSPGSQVTLVHFWQVLHRVQEASADRQRWTEVHRLRIAKYAFPARKLQTMSIPRMALCLRTAVQAHAFRPTERQAKVFVSDLTESIAP